MDDFENDLIDPFENVHLFIFPLAMEEKEIKIRFSIKHSRGSKIWYNPPSYPLIQGAWPLQSCKALPLVTKLVVFPKRGLKSREPKLAPLPMYFLQNVLTSKLQ